eukprot:1380815-Amphidinium_carterae.1
MSIVLDEVKNTHLDKRRLCMVRLLVRSAPASVKVSREAFDLSQVEASHDLDCMADAHPSCRVTQICMLICLNACVSSDPSTTRTCQPPNMSQSCRMLYRIYRYMES